jgi:hypothetical protein
MSIASISVFRTPLKQRECIPNISYPHFLVYLTVNAMAFGCNDRQRTPPSGIPSGIVPFSCFYGGEIDLLQTAVSTNDKEALIRKEMQDIALFEPTASQRILAALSRTLPRALSMMRKSNGSDISMRRNPFSCPIFNCSVYIYP